MNDHEIASVVCGALGLIGAACIGCVVIAAILWVAEKLRGKP